MSRYYLKYNIISTILITFVMSITLTGCSDDFIEPERIPDAEVTIKGEVFFKPLVSTEVHTRSDAPDGAKYTGIKTLYVMFFDIEKQLLREYSGYVDFIDAPAEDDSDERVTFKKKIPAGHYYAYAIANISDEQKNDFEQIETVEELRNFKLNWNDDIEKDLEMFGVFKHNDSEYLPDNESFEADALLTITPHTNSIHSWVRRAVSKITIDFDGTNLKDGVTVHIKNATLKDVSSGALLGTSPSGAGADGITCTQSAYSITYGRGADHNAWPTVTNAHSLTPSEVWGDGDITNFHDDNAKALPCYENMQGEPEGKSKLQDANEDGIIDSYRKDGVDNGTYLEVEGYYVTNRPEYKSQGKIIYRFMLGRDAMKNFDLVRNHHYKITMRFKDYGNDIDWHIEYSEKYLDATYPEDVNYRGKFFVPDKDYSNLPNAGHAFSNQNVITVKSYETDGTNKTWKDPEISYSYYSYNEQTGKWDTDNTASGWLTATPGEINEDGTQKKYTFVASMTEPESVTINSLFPTTAKGSETSPHNLSNENGGSTVENTANCYMVGAPGWYCFPLVYGNAITGKKDNTAAYASVHMVNHLNNHITKPYIKDNTGIDLSNVSIKLIWQDAENLIKPDEISYEPGLFGGKGGIKFHIGAIQEGNAVIALIDNNAEEDEYVSAINRGVYGVSGSTKAIWSWHIWATRFGFGNFETDIRILNHDEKEFNVMPVNLGWCSGGKAIRYHKRRKCEIKFKTGEHELVRTIEQYPHLVLPRGDHPYYQWGRKDPFVGSNLAYGNKVRWNHDGTKYDVWSDYNPPRLYQEPAEYQHNAGRKHSKDCLDVLIKNPDKWHNAPRKPNNPNDFNSGFYSTNESFTDLWSNNGEKTVYDPCPSGYQIGDNTVFTGFTTSGNNAIYSIHWHDVLDSNTQLDYYAGNSVNSQILEFYTDTRKIHSITFPVTGYRDYDSKASLVTYPTENYNGQGYVWFNVAKDQTYSYHLKFIRGDLNGADWKDRTGPDQIIAPCESFYNTDGFGVRPVRYAPK